MLNPVEILSKFGVVFSEHHPSVGNRAVGVDCPFCPGGDNDKHVGVFRDGQPWFSCWRCGAKGSLYKLIRASKGITWDQYAEVCGIGKMPSTENPIEVLNNIFGQSKLQTPSQSSKFAGNLPAAIPPANSIPILSAAVFHPGLNKYIASRGFDLDWYHHMGCLFCISGDWMNRIVIPIQGPGNIIIGWIGRSIDSRDEIRYKFETTFQKSHHVYYTHHTNPRHSWLIVSEGVYDTWGNYHMLGVPSVGIFGHHLHQAQSLAIRYLANALGVEFVIVMMDGDSPLDSLKIAEQIRGLSEVPVYSYQLPTNEDPASMYTHNKGEWLENQLTQRFRPKV